MNTYCMSPARKAGLRIIRSSAPRVGDWLRFNCGDRVREPDGRHEGIVVAISGSEVKVRWEDTRWTSWLYVGDLKLVERVRR